MSSELQERPKSSAYDLILQGGTVIDPVAGTSQRADVAIAAGRIARIERDIPVADAARVVDVAGKYVTPGLIDIHVHLDPHYYVGGIVADGQSFSAGVTTMVDAGSSGANNWDVFNEVTVKRSKTRVLAFLNVVDAGMLGEVEQDTFRMRSDLAAEVACAYPDVIVGIKVAHYWTWQPYDADHGPWTNVDRGVAAARLCGKPLMVDFWPRPERPYEDLILSKLGPGDIHTHVFAQQFPIIREDGTLNPALLEARERGVIFDCGHGGGSFWFRNAVPAVRQGFVPDSMGTDLHTGNAANGLVTNILNVMSKFMNMGVPLEDVIYRATVAPAREVGHPELGTLAIGAPADVAVLEVLEGSFGFIDCGRAKMLGDRKLHCVFTLRDGQVAYDPEGLTMPRWEEAPPAYWTCRQPGPR